MTAVRAAITGFARHIDPHRSFAARISLAFALAMLLLTAGLSLLTGRLSESWGTKETGTVLAGVAARIAREFEQEVQAASLEVQEFARIPPFRDPAAPREELRSVLEFIPRSIPSVAWAGLLDGNGTVIAATGGFLEGANVGSLPLVQRGLAGPAVSDAPGVIPLIDPLETAPTLDLAAPVHDGAGRPWAVLVVRLSRQWARDILLPNWPMLEPEQIDVYVADARGRVFLTTAEAGAISSLEDLTDGAPPLRAGADSRWQADRRYVTGYARDGGDGSAPDLGWTSVVRQPAAIALAPVRRHQRTVEQYGLAAGLAFTAGGWVITRRLIRPINQIATAADRARQSIDRFTLPAADRIDEIGLLTTSLSGFVHEVDRQRTELRLLNQSLEEQLAQRQHAEAELLHSEARFRALVQSASDIIAVTDRLGFLRYISPSAALVLGYEPEEQLGRQAFSLVHPDDLVTLQRRFASIALRTGVHPPLEFRLRHADGSWRYLEAAATNLLDEPSVAGIVLNIRDITPHKRAEAVIEAARREAERANQAKTEFLSRVSHELRTPLTGILGYAQLLELDAETADVQENVQAILTAGRHLHDLIGEVLDISRIEAGTMTLSVTSVDLAAAIEAAVAIVEPMAVESAIELRRFSIDRCRVLADPQRLKQVLLNLLSNAVKFTPAGGWVEIAVTAVGSDRVRIAVIDSGPGIPAERLPRLFQPFERLNADQCGIAGTGLGLAVSRHLVELMGGAVGVESTVGEGSTFWVEVARGAADLDSGGMIAVVPAR